MDLHLNLKFAGRSISFRPKSLTVLRSFKPVPSGTALSKIQLLAPYSPVESQLVQQQRKSESAIAHQQSQLPTASFLKWAAGKKSLKLCKIYPIYNAVSFHFMRYSDEKQDQPLITEEAFFCWILHVEINTKVLQKPLVQYSVLSETSFHIMQGLRRQSRRSIIRFLDQMHYLMYVVGKRENGLQILYHCLKETQYRFPEHRMIVHYLERNGRRNTYFYS